MQIEADHSVSHMNYYKIFIGAGGGGRGGRSGQYLRKPPRPSIAWWTMLAVTVVTVAMVANLFNTRPAVTVTDRSSVAGGSGNSSSGFRTSATLCDPIIPINQIHRGFFHAQSGEDRALLSYPFFTNLCNGTYLELGALDGSQFSNTYVFNKVLGWKGVLIELTPSKYAALVQNRPDDITVHAAVCNTKQTVHYVDMGRNGAVSGVWEFASESFRQMWWKETNLSATIPIECQPLREILATHSGARSYFDVFSLDVEGSELEVLKSIDFTVTGFGVVLIEADDHNLEKNQAVRKLLQQNGYIYFNSHQRSDWFVNDQFNKIYANVTV